jgi:uncharacterized delta-60 repeat protein
MPSSGTSTHVKTRSTAASRWVGLAVLLSVASTSAVVPAATQAGKLDRSFGHQGIALTGFGDHLERHSQSTKQIQVEASGKIVLGTEGPRGGFTIERLDPDGVLDQSFGSDGTVATEINGESMAVQSNSSVIVAGSIGEGDPGRDFAVMRYLPDGKVDRSFGDSGLVRFRKGLEDVAESVVLQPDGTIVVAGRSSCGEREYGCGWYTRSEVVLMRLSPDGKLISRTSYDKTKGYGLTLAVGSGGQIVLAAETFLTRNPSQLIHFRPDGKLQAGFGKGGAVPIPGNSYTDTFTLQPDDKPLLAASRQAVGVLRLAPDGIPDASFGEGGKVQCVPTGTQYSSGRSPRVATLPNGRLLASGGGGDCGLARYLSDGTPDASFGIGGRVDVGSALGGPAEALAAGPNDAAIVVRWQNGTGFRVARYLADGSLDSSFGVGGVATVPGRAATFDQVNALLPLDKGKLLAVGTSGCGDRSCGEFALARYRADGTLDRSFGQGGLSRTPLEGVGLATSGAIQRNGRIVLGGAIGVRKYGELKDERLALARYTPNGVLDSSFGKAGIVTIPSAQGEDVQVNALAVAPDGDVIAAGEASCTDSRECGKRYCSECASYVVARFRPNGSPDRGFGKAGVMRIDVGHNDEDHDAARAVAVQPDGKIVVAGRSFGGFGLVRLLPDGRLDPSFGHRGFARTSFSIRLRADDGKFFSIGVDRPATSMALMPNGKIVVGGGIEVSKQYPSEKAQNHSVIVRYRPNGWVDSTFGTDGLESIEGLAIKALTVDRCGRPVVAGAFSAKAGGTRFGVARLLPSGGLDRSFSKWVVHAALGTAEDSHANAVALSQGNVIAAGVAANAGAGDDFTLAAFRAGRAC